jgi:hypothetical protein
VNVRWLLLAIIAGACLLALAIRGPIPQDLAYHQFADHREMLGIPNFWNVISNAGFLIVGLSGLRALRSEQISLPLRPAWLAFFVAVVFVSLGSAYYHVAPDNGTLTWDRLPMALAFMAFLAITIGERLEPEPPRLLLPLLLFCGAASVGYWHLSELHGRGDLRPYLLVQFMPLIVVALFPPLGSRRKYATWAMLITYLIAKAMEILDERIFHLQATISGHSLKHVIAATGLYFLVRTFGQRCRLR